MRKNILFVLMIALLFFSCGKSEPGDEPAHETAGSLYPKFRIAAYRDINLKQWAFTTARGEKVSLVSTVKGEEGDLVEIMRADGESRGYAEAKYFAEGVCALTGDDTPLYAQPTMTSEIEIRLPRGTVLFITGEKDGWLNVYAGKFMRSGKVKWVTSAWIQEGYSREEETVSAALLLERALEDYAGEDGDKKAASEITLREIASSDNIFAGLAIEALHSNEEEY